MIATDIAIARAAAVSFCRHAEIASALRIMDARLSSRVKCSQASAAMRRFRIDGPIEEMLRKLRPLWRHRRVYFIRPIPGSHVSMQISPQVMPPPCSPRHQRLYSFELRDAYIYMFSAERTTCSHDIEIGIYWLSRRVVIAADIGIGRRHRRAIASCLRLPPASPQSRQPCTTLHAIYFLMPRRPLFSDAEAGKRLTGCDVGEAHLRHGDTAAASARRFHTDTEAFSARHCAAYGPEEYDGFFITHVSPGPPPTLALDDAKALVSHFAYHARKRPRRVSPLAARLGGLMIFAGPAAVER